MALGPRLELRQGQSLVMTPQLMQAIKLLQMSNLDLVAYVEAELERNPFLEPIADQPERLDLRGLEREAAGVADTPAPSAPERPEDWLSSDLTPDAGAIAERFDTAVENVFPEAVDGGGAPAAGGPTQGLSLGRIGPGGSPTASSTSRTGRAASARCTNTWKSSWHWPSPIRCAG